jgi:ankyrin repeat protein
MTNIWIAAKAGDLDEVQRLVGHDASLLNAVDRNGYTPLMWASARGHINVVGWLIDKKAAIQETSNHGFSALWFACTHGHPLVARLLLQRGADPTIASVAGTTPLMMASTRPNLEVVHVMLSHPGAEATKDHRDPAGKTALWWACHEGLGGGVRALLDCGADPTIAGNDGTTPLAIAKTTAPLPSGVTIEGRRECVAMLEVRSCSPIPPPRKLLFPSVG